MNKWSTSRPNTDEQGLKLHPQNYLEVNGRIIFYFDKIRHNDAEEAYESLQKAKTLVITSRRRNSEQLRTYFLYIGSLVLKFSESNKYNFLVYDLLKGKKARELRNNLYDESEGIFTVIPKGGVSVISRVGGTMKIRPATANNSWKMDEHIYDQLVGQMEKHFDRMMDSGSEDEKAQITRHFEENVFKPFRDYTDKEYWVEKTKQLQEKGLTYYARRFEKKTKKGSVYSFFTNEPLVIQEEEQETTVFNIGDRVTVIGADEEKERPITGVIENIEPGEDEDTTAVSIAFYHQSDDDDFPKSGVLVMAVNDTQTRVRKQVVRAIESKKVESQYMYRTFSDFSTAGYKEIPQDLKDFIREELVKKFPPNQMQLEAIIKGILTEDILLVLGPPGTGKTTVISFWVKYFIKHGMRVLISSQNNSAVDNVLARFKKDGEIVRLGNESKVQEDCKEFLPQYKIETMQRHFNENQARLEKDLNDDLVKMEKYRSALITFLKLNEELAEITGKLTGVLKPVTDILHEQALLYSQVRSAEEQLKNNEDQKARSTIFLQEYNKKNFFIKWLHKKYAAIAEKNIREYGQNKEKLLLRREHMAQRYNVLTQELKKSIRSMRETGVVAQYVSATEEINAHNDLLYRGEQYPPVLRSEIARFYHAPKYSADPGQNLKIASAEVDVINEFVKKANKVIGYTRQWNSIVNNDRNDIMQNVLLETCQIVGATCIGINSNRDFANVKFDVAIVDESGQIQIHNALIPMSRAPKNLLLGDYMQIPPSADQDVVKACKEDGININLLEMSFFEFLFGKIGEKIRKEYAKNDPDSEGEKTEKEKKEEEYKKRLLAPAIPDYDPLRKSRAYSAEEAQKMIVEAISDPKKLVNLNHQFRMPGSISSVISEWFYDNNYFSSYDMSRFQPLLPGTEHPLVILSTSEDNGRFEMQPDNKMGYMNHHEAKIVAEIVAQVIRGQDDGKRTDYISKIEHKIGIISAYGAQVRLIRDYIARRNPEISHNQIRGMVASLDSFQGQERPLIIYSLTRSRKNGNPREGRVGFMKELRRLNVAFTRSQQQLVVIGDVRYLSSCMNMQKTEDAKGWPCSDQVENKVVGLNEIKQCSACGSSSCERKFARFIRLLMQHVSEGDGELITFKDTVSKI